MKPWSLQWHSGGPGSLWRSSVHLSWCYKTAHCLERTLIIMTSPSLSWVYTGGVGVDQPFRFWITLVVCLVVVETSFWMPTLRLIKTFVVLKLHGNFQCPWYYRAHTGGPSWPWVVLHIPRSSWFLPTDIQWIVVVLVPLVCLVEHSMSCKQFACLKISLLVLSVS